MAYAVVGFSTLIVNGVQGRFDAQWLQRTQDRGADHLVHALGSGQDNPTVLARRMYSPTVEGEAWMERAMARIDSPASKNSRSTRWILRMDNLLKAIDISSLKGARRCHDEELSRAARSFRPGARNDFGHRRKVIGLGPESVIGFVRNR